MKKMLAALVALPAAPAMADTSAEEAWEILNQITFEESDPTEEYAVFKTFPAEIADGAEAFEVSGYAIPTDEAGKSFLLVSDIAECPYCGSGDHGVTVNVVMAEALPGIEESTRIVLRGNLQPVHDTETWQSVILSDAVRIDV